MTPSGLLVVEQRFHEEHVGVRRVVRWYAQQLKQAGYNITLATPVEGGLAPCSNTLYQAKLLEIETERGDVKLPCPDWQKGQAVPSQPPQNAQERPSAKTWWQPKARIHPTDFNLSILTNPWLCNELATTVDRPYTMGIAYDMVPQLLSMGVLRMPRFLDAYEFARKHRVGYAFFAKHCQRISCISRSTRADFLRLTPEVPCIVDVCIPFSGFGTSTADPQGRTILLVNVLDDRKNFAVVLKALRLLAPEQEVSVTVVGRERMAWTDVLDFLNELNTLCFRASWYRSPSDTQLQILMKTSRVLFFPSIYEGLGLPILEAQAQGLPVISASNSSCGEVNLNPDLIADPHDAPQFAQLLSRVLDNVQGERSGSELGRAQQKFLSTHAPWFRTGSARSAVD